jgi:hypothetical protein
VGVCAARVWLAMRGGRCEQTVKGWASCSNCKSKRKSLAHLEEGGGPSPLGDDVAGREASLDCTASGGELLRRVAGAAKAVIQEHQHRGQQSEEGPKCLEQGRERDKGEQGQAGRPRRRMPAAKASRRLCCGLLA